MICKSCKQDKGVDFYANDSKCKSCRCSMVRANRARNISHYRDYDNKRAMRPDRVEKRKEYARTPVGRIVCSNAKYRWAAKNPLKKQAANAVCNAIRGGRLIRGLCEVCGNTNTQGHHDDYSKPLEVRWLCAKHHKSADRERRVKESQKHLQKAGATIYQSK